MAWDVYKAHRESEQREHVTIAAFKEEMVANRAIAENNSRNRSREEYRLNNSGHAAYQRRLKIYDSHLIEWEELLLKQVKELEAPIK